MKVMIAGSSGLVGSALSRAYKNIENVELIEVNRSVVDLLDLEATNNFVIKNKPDLIIDAAAKVGGIGANNSQPVEFLNDNLRIQMNLMHSAHVSNVEKFIFLGSSCIYPRNAEQPIIESALLTGQLESTNSAYAIAKIAGIELIKSYRKEYGHKWISLMPTNLYGPNDNFSLDSSHVLPALIRKFSDATENGAKTVELWGTGSPLREFLHVHDLASAVVLCHDKYDEESHINIGSGIETSIFNLASIIAKQLNFEGEILWDSTKPDGTPRKVLDVRRIKSLGWSPKVDIENGIKNTISWYSEAKRLGTCRI